MPNLTVDPQPDTLTSADSFSVNPSPHNLSKSILIGVLIFVLLSLTAYGAYWYGQSVNTAKLTPSTSSSTGKVSSFSNVPTPKPVLAPVEETASWETYTNDVLSFKYPSDSDWKVYPSENFSVAVMCETCLTNSTVDLFQVAPVIFKSIDDYMIKDTLSMDKRRIKLSGLDAVEGVQSGGPQAGGSFITVFVVYRGQGYLLSERFRKLYDKNSLGQFSVPMPDLLPTFKFL